MRHVTLANQSSFDRTITEEVLKYQKTGHGFHRLIERLAPMIYNFPRSMRCETEDDCGDFYCYFIPRVTRIIERFVYSGRDFEVYLTASMKWQYKSFISQTAKRNLSHRTVKNTEFWPEHESFGDPTLVCEQPALTSSARKKLEVSNTGVVSNPVIARRLLLLTLKASQELQTDTISRAASLIGIDESWLLEKIQELNSRLGRRRERREMLRRRRDRAYFRMCYFQKRILSEFDNHRRKEFERMMIAEREHLTNARNALSRVPITPTHKDIAILLDIPKGSVDSALYYVRNTCEDLLNNIESIEHGHN